MVLSLIPAAVGVLATGLLTLTAVLGGALTRTAGAIAFAFGSVIVIAAGFPYLALLVLFVLASVLATRFRFEEKKRRHVEEGTRGERGVSNVLAHILVPTALALYLAFASPGWPSISVAVLYTAALAFGASDTFASELGVLSGSARSLLSGRPVPPGTNGGVSGAGELWALVGAATTGVVGLGLFELFGELGTRPALYLGVAIAAGFAGCQIDSVVGELLENRGYLTKGGTNLTSMAATVLVAAVLLWGLGGR